MVEEQEFMEPQTETAQTGAETEGESSAPETAEAGTQETSPEPEKKDGVQKRIDELVRQREEARREQEYWREMAMRGFPRDEPKIDPIPLENLNEPKSDDYEIYDEFVAAHSKWAKESAKREFKAEQEAARQAEIKTREAETINNWQKSGASKYRDWQEVFHPHLPVSDAMARTLLEIDQGHDIAYYLGKNPSEAQRIYNLPPHRQAYELGKIEARLSGPPQKTTTKAPTPTSPVGGKEVPTKSLENMSTEEYIAYMDRREFGK